ncbi:NADH-FMN oxidoreductase RutF, flavin reductase (DIM6/NTAB) family [Deinococcus reticulitermitis]|uniref:NADH-FMN oxidoreductase RutF, flavin reductase (DIM6/NTAB) family n=1 Tax=Deinococcus reticulitermitis TaxID=856736 RepID=A0A1H6ZE02_9DEIO|nr:flavin reductase family protein [Deinococcus reticulitermitis]SEJ50354.1 NADH-FMN oxidoreductase RutF, flavin reductase (DIM6/NTAB) family [Deinococcus reticulitermitis]
MTDSPAPVPPTLADSYKALARTWAATVTVVTLLDEHGDLDGFTATAFLTVSIDPPIILVSVQRSSLASETLSKCQAFAVNLLSPTQAEIAGTFARPQVQRREAWDRVPWKEGVEGAPLLTGTAGAFTATVRQVIEAGDHLLVLGDVQDIHLHEGGATLLYHDRRFGKVEYHP